VPFRTPPPCRATKRRLQIDDPHGRGTGPPERSKLRGRIPKTTRDPTPTTGRAAGATAKAAKTAAALRPQEAARLTGADAPSGGTSARRQAAAEDTRMPGGPEGVRGDGPAARSLRERAGGDRRAGPRGGRGPGMDTNGGVPRRRPAAIEVSADATAPGPAASPRRSEEQRRRASRARRPARQGKGPPRSPARLAGGGGTHGTARSKPTRGQPVHSASSQPSGDRPRPEPGAKQGEGEPRLERQRARHTAELEQQVRGPSRPRQAGRGAAGKRERAKEGPRNPPSQTGARAPSRRVFGTLGSDRTALMPANSQGPRRDQTTAAPGTTKPDADGSARSRRGRGRATPEGIRRGAAARRGRSPAAQPPPAAGGDGVGRRGIVDVGRAGLGEPQQQRRGGNAAEGPAQQVPGGERELNVQAERFATSKRESTAEPWAGAGRQRPAAS